MQFRRTILSIIILAFYSCNSYSATVLLNGDFENGNLEPWFQGIGSLDYSHDHYWHVTSNMSFSGNYSITNNGNNEIRQDFDPISTSLISEISFYMLKDVNAPETAIQFHYSDGFREQIIISTSGVNTWDYFDIHSQLDINKELTGISFFGTRTSTQDGINLYLDNVNVIATPLPPSLLLFISPLITYFAFGFTRKKHSIDNKT